jgi:glyoxalase family protein
MNILELVRAISADLLDPQLLFRGPYMNTNPRISGIHHITAIASSASENLSFYETVLGLRLVKKTVNFDDPYTYHLYYGDSIGSPSTILTFFPWEKLPRGRSEAGMVTAVAFSIPTDSVGYWQKRINLYAGITKEAKRFGDRVVQLEDNHGLPLELIETSTAPFTSAFNGSSIPPDHRIVGLHSATVPQRSYEETAFLLPDQYEPMRAEIERRLPNLDLRKKNIRLAAGSYL